jgi:hypothetical protein
VDFLSGLVVALQISYIVLSLSKIDENSCFFSSNSKASKEEYLALAGMMMGVVRWRNPQYSDFFVMVVNEKRALCTGLGQIEVKMQGNEPIL